MRRFSDSTQASAHAPWVSSTLLRKLIRCKRTGAFLTKDGTWSQDIKKALVVAEHAAPEAARAQFQPQELELYYSFEQDRISQYDFTLSVR